MGGQSEREGARVLPGWVTPDAVRGVVRVELGLEGDWTSTARPIWAPGRHLDLGNATLRHAVRRPALEIRRPDGWIGLLASGMNADGYFMDEAFLRNVISFVESAGGPGRWV